MKPVILTTLALAIAIASPHPADDRPDFSGSYKLTDVKGSEKFDKTTVQTLKVAQSTDAIEVTEDLGGKPHTDKYPLDGSEGAYTSPEGIPGKCKAHFKGKSLILESLTASRPATNAPVVELLTVQRWELSADKKKLAVHIEVISPNMHVSPVAPWTEIYMRD